MANGGAHMNREELISFFNEMQTTQELITWFSAQSEYFFQEWPRGGGPYFKAIDCAKSSKHGMELKEYLLALETDWHKPT